MKKVRNINHYALRLAYNFYKNNKKYFKLSAIDWEDVKQEIIFKVYNIEKIYEEKYKNIKRVYLIKHIKTMVYNYLRNLLRDNNKKSFLNINIERTNKEKAIKLRKKGFSILQIAKKIQSSKDEINKWLIEDKDDKHEVNQMVSISQEELENITLSQSKNSIERFIFDDFIETMLEKFTNNDKELQIIRLKIIGNFTFQEIGKKLHISRSRAQKIYKKTISKIRAQKDDIMNGF